jgi:DNA-binding NtrC family response regulator
VAAIHRLPRVTNIPPYKNPCGHTKIAPLYPMTSLLFAWLGTADINGSKSGDPADVGPICQAVRWKIFDRVIVLADQGKKAEEYCEWLTVQCEAKVEIRPFKLSSPTHFGEIYEAAVSTVASVSDGDRTFHLSPGTPAMCAVWVILAKTRFPATLIESSKMYGVKVSSVPFDLSADYLPDLIRKPDEDLTRLSQGLPPQNAEFDAILHRSDVMKRVVVMARRVAPRNIPVLLLGESGTGKELFARAIHHSSPRREKPFVAVNCGAIPEELVDAELFGHEKGAFTGANVARPGYIVAAHGGTLFLDEIGDLPIKSQVRLLRVIQEGEVTRIGATSAKKVDFRLICATNRQLASEVNAHRFREDLYHRIAVAVINLPALRDRGGDLGLLIEKYMEHLNRESRGQPGHEDKKLSAGARNVLLNHDYPGNIRELINILQRAIVWSPRSQVSEADIRGAIIPSGKPVASDVLGRPLGESLILPDLIASVARHYLTRALEEAAGNKTKAAELLGLPSYQTLTNWMKRYDVSDSMARDMK